MMNRDVSPQMLTQFVLQIGDRCRSDVDLSGSPRSFFPAAKMSRNEAFSLAHARVATQNRLRQFELFLLRFYSEQNLGVPNREMILCDPSLDLWIQIEQAHRICDR